MKQLFKIFIILSVVSISAFAAFVAPGQAPVLAFGNSQYKIVYEDMEWVIGDTSDKVIVRMGFVTDYASIPSLLGRIIGLSSEGQYSRAALIHDYLYWTQVCTRKQSDNLLLIAMKESNASWYERFMISSGVYMGGSFAWEANSKERASGLPKIVPEEYMEPKDTNMNWPEYRKLLFDKGVKDPQFEENPTFCKYGDSTEVPIKPTVNPD